MKSVLKIVSLLLFLAITLSSCNVAREQTVWQRGQHYFAFTGYEPLAHLPINVHYFIPSQGDIDTMRVVMAMHGALRNGAFNVSQWTNLAERGGFIVIAPEFPRDEWSVNMYQFGNVFTDSTFTVVNPKEKWAYNAVEAIFDYFLKTTGNRSEKYFINGHSAGGQFVHRMVLAMPNNRIKFAVASNPSSWTHAYVDGVVDAQGNVFGWPFSIKDSPFTDEETIKRYLAFPMVIQLGTADTSTTAHDLDRSIGAQATGTNRYCRGIAFFDSMKQLARDMNTPFNWQRVDVEGIGHSGRGMIYGRIMGEDEEGNPVFCIDNITTTGAYYLIFQSR
ncbi:MAG: hypothetical protein FWC94_01590 [Bacteroidales bacterium]|nr:hypothetical protein [Bacteroidales bacterium]